MEVGLAVVPVSISVCHSFSFTSSPFCRKLITPISSTPPDRNRHNGGSGGLSFDHPSRRSTFGGGGGKSDSHGGAGPWREMRDETSHNNGVAPNPKSHNPFADPEGGWGGDGVDPYPQAHMQQGKEHVPTHGRDRSFGGGGPNGDGMYPVRM
jgi:hypothetical protein